MLAAVVCMVAVAAASATRSPQRLNATDLTAVRGAACEKQKQEVCETAPAKSGCADQPCQETRNGVNALTKITCPAGSAEQRNKAATYNKRVAVVAGEQGNDAYIQQAPPADWTVCVEKADCDKAGNVQGNGIVPIVGAVTVCQSVNGKYVCLAPLATATWAPEKRHEIWQQNGGSCPQG